MMPTPLKYLGLFLVLLLLKVNLAIPSYLIGQVINHASQSTSFDGAEPLLMYLLLSTLAVISLSPFFTYFFEQAVQVNVELKSKALFHQLLAKPFNQLKQLEIGALASKFERGIGSYEQFINLSVSRGLPLAIESLVFAGALILFTGWRTLFVVLLILCASTLLNTAIIQRRRPQIAAVNQAEDEILDQTVAVFSGIRTIQANQVERFFEHRLAPFFTRYRQATVSLAVSRSLFDGVSVATLSLISLAIMTLFVLYLIPAEQADAGELVTALLLSASMTRAFSGLLDVYRLVDQSREDFSALKYILENHTTQSQPSPRLAQILSALEHPTDRTIAVVGQSGLGKTVLLDSLSGLLTPDRVTSFSTGYLEQTNFIFSGSVYDNLTLGKAIERDWLERQLDSVGLASRLSLETKLQGNGENLSGGEKRRLCFLRAYIHNPDLLLLDEPTAGLDKASANALWAMIFRCLPPHTKMVAVTHDESHLEHFDVVIRLD
ncbi:ATP-binding cassette domain-containing protein [Vibrio sp. 16]|uniref:ATP-binding cassette domain-containing protein n=1 Tax=Vibrio sp. 16 TaxID=391586 RepID=UPI00018F40D5|nr:ATP-binding cassette domain-containing protein [Vibrio sp. 16]EED25395.1 ABC transporter, ATP-binding protein [Vibrio sp. 16]CAK4076540.1 Vitamin B12 import ATP-binding protein BtuD, type I secretion system permease/ATPase, ATP-binding cassette domain-containing protein, ABC-type bacteriocin/lantibiotic exporters, contain an N-terminal double-glycine peptidase domain [Vibrio sp. 16]